MKCPYCGFQDSKVMESRSSKEDSRIKRRRECESCEKRFTTFEEIEHTPIIVIKKDGKREQFDRKKIFNGILKACEKRAIPLQKIEDMVSEIEHRSQNLMDKEIKVENIGELVMDQLKMVDDVAYIRFASVYRQFKDVNAFMEELKGLLK